MESEIIMSSNMRIDQLDADSKEGILLMRAIGLLMATARPNSTPEEVLRELDETGE
jgi:hypothetical protein